MHEIATFGAGCFWGVEWVFRQVPGVLEAVSGYAGGFVDDPDYRLVCTGTTGHAEVVQVEFDPAVVTYEQLLEVFWAMHDPTQVNRQGPDVGDQYRSAIFTHRPSSGRRPRPRASGRRRPSTARSRPRSSTPAVLPRRGVPPALLRADRARAVLPRAPDGGARALGLVATDV